MRAELSICQRADNSKDHAQDICNPIGHVCAAPERRLNELNNAPKGTGTNKDRDKPKASRAGKREGEGGKGCEMYKFITALRRRGRLMDRPKHGHCQYSSYNQCERDIEILAHVNRV